MSPKKSERINVCDDCIKNCGKYGIQIELKYRFPKTRNDNNICEICERLIPDYPDDYDSEPRQKLKTGEKHMKKTNKNQQMYIGVLMAVIIIGGVLLYFLYRQSLTAKDSNEFDVTAAVKNLKQKYSNENRVLWQNVMKIVNDSQDSVHSFILLYKGNGADAAECFAKDLIAIINKMHNNVDVVTYQNKNNVDYGDELHHYMNVVRESKHMIVPKLQKINGMTARMFHTLCDVGEHSIKPSYFIFTLEDTSNNIDPGLEKKNPFVRVGKILRNAWSNVAENELHPLISRIVRNVAEISGENVTC